jgi:hypothetical protein
MRPRRARFRSSNFFKPHRAAVMARNATIAGLARAPETGDSTLSAPLRLLANVANCRPLLFPGRFLLVARDQKHFPDQRRTSALVPETTPYKIELLFGGALPLGSGKAVRGSVQRHDHGHTLVHSRATPHPASLAADRGRRGREYRQGRRAHEHVAIGSIAPAERSRRHHRFAAVRPAATWRARELVRPDHDPACAHRARQPE